MDACLIQVHLLSPLAQRLQMVIFFLPGLPETEPPSVIVRQLRHMDRMKTLSCRRARIRGDLIESIRGDGVTSAIGVTSRFNLLGFLNQIIPRKL